MSAVRRAAPISSSTPLVEAALVEYVEYLTRAIGYSDWDRLACLDYTVATRETEQATLGAVAGSVVA